MAAPLTWDLVPYPDVMPFHYNDVDRHLAHTATLEAYVVLERAMATLWPGFKFGKRNFLTSATKEDGRRVRKVGHLDVEASLRIMLDWDHLGKHLWALVSGLRKCTPHHHLLLF